MSGRWRDGRCRLAAWHPASKKELTCDKCISGIVMKCEDHSFKSIDKLFSLISGKNFKCQRCGRVFVYSRGWINFLPMVFAFTFVFAIKASSSYSGGWPYAIWFIFSMLCFYLAYRFIPVQSVDTAGKVVCAEHRFNPRDKLFATLSGKPFKCQECGCIFIFSRSWMSLLTVVEVFAFCFAIAGSAMYRSFWPYGMWLLFFILCSCLVYRFIPIQPIEENGS
jgi:uncharacterized C2H2 Zn-finger protein